ncbi:MAG: type II toxin-antitoxin system VapC family toxin [Desulfobacteraceae bacterium]
MKRKKLLDSYALLAYLNKERNFQKVQKALSAAQSSGGSLLMNEINVGETYYILHRKRNREAAEFFLDTVLPGLPITVLSNRFEDVMAAARIKAEYPLSFADCFAAATARREDAMVLTGDPEFKKIEHMVTIDLL